MISSTYSKENEEQLIRFLFFKVRTCFSEKESHSWTWELFKPMAI
jgi:hypothetical protein